jgi:uncharacterized RDD family membrane protein YckC
MDFYYSKDGQSMGPIPEAKFNSLVENGEITAQTSVWKEGMGDWKDYGEVAADFVPSEAKGNILIFDTSDLELALAKVAAAAQSVEIKTEMSDTRPAAPSGPMEEKKTLNQPSVEPAGSNLSALARPEPVSTHACSQCGKTFAEETMITYEEVWVCADCKPAFFQKLREEILADSGLAKAGWVRRAAAKVMDLILLVLFFLMVQVPVIGLLFNGGKPIGTGSLLEPLGANLLWGIGLTLFYGVFFMGRYGATVGKLAFHLRVVNLDGSEVSYEMALARCAVEFLTLFTLQNRICSTRVVKDN